MISPRRAGIALLLVLLAACGDDAMNSTTTVPASTSTAAPTTTAAAPTTTAVPVTTTTVAAPLPLAEVAITVELVAGGFTQPIFVTARPGDDRLYVADQEGIVYALGGEERTVVLDINTLTRFAGEQGLLGLAFHPTEPSRMFVHYSDNNGDTVVAEYSFPVEAAAADPDPAGTILFLTQPASNHNGGMIGFGPDGHLYVALGDGGGGGDPWNNAQDPFTLLGKILRLNVNVVGTPYAIPADNPFANGAEGAPEVWLLGLRNPWRFSFDGDDLWIGDVGQELWEEITRVGPDDGGANLGWNVFEGAHCFAGSDAECANPAFVGPTYEYRHSGGRCTVIGGYVYRGSAIPGLVGAYLFSDWCTGGVMAIRVDESGAVVDEAFLAETDWRLTSFGVDLAGEVYITREDGVYRVVPAG